jgi:nucleotide-binding universal stress UspA family protein
VYHVVVGVDDNAERAVTSARAVVDLPGPTAETAATVVHVFAEATERTTVTDVEAVEAAAGYLSERGVDVDSVGASGDPVERILGVAADVGADLIVLSGRRRSPTGTALFGSISRSVILASDRPVLITGAASR